MALRVQRVLHLVGEFDITATRRQAHGLEVEHPTDTQATLDDVPGEVEILRPVGGEEHARQMPARRMPRHIDAVGIASKMLGIVIYPCNRAAYLLGHRYEAATDVLDPCEVGHHVVRATVHEQLGG